MSYFPASSDIKEDKMSNYKKRKIYNRNKAKNCIFQKEQNMETFTTFKLYIEKQSVICMISFS